MELEIKHLAPYLPYGFKIKDSYNKKIHTIVKGDAMDYVMLSYKTDKPHKIVLRPIEDLVKEIEIDGLKFIPIMVLFGGENYKEYDFTIDIVEKPIMGRKIEISVKDLGSPCVTFGIKYPINNILHYENWQLLFKWHFDIFGLIKQGLAIDINTLSVNGS